MGIAGAAHDRCGVLFCHVADLAVRSRGLALYPAGDGTSNTWAALEVAGMTNRINVERPQVVPMVVFGRRVTAVCAAQGPRTDEFAFSDGPLDCSLRTPDESAGVSLYKISIGAMAIASVAAVRAFVALRLHAASALPKMSGRSSCRETAPSVTASTSRQRSAATPRLRQLTTTCGVVLRAAASAETPPASLIARSMGAITAHYTRRV